MDLKTTKLGLGIVIGAIFATILILFAFLDSRSQNASASIIEGQGYYASSTDATFTVAPGFKVLRIGGGIFGSLVVSTTGSGVINIYDATTTTNGSIYGTTTIAHLTTTAVGTYTYDVTFNRGLLVETVGSNTGSTTITWK